MNPYLSLLQFPSALRTFIASFCSLFCLWRFSVIQVMVYPTAMSQEECGLVVDTWRLLVSCPVKKPFGLNVFKNQQAHFLTQRFWIFAHSIGFPARSFTVLFQYDWSLTDILQATVFKKQHQKKLPARHRQQQTDKLSEQLVIIQPDISLRSYRETKNRAKRLM